MNKYLASFALAAFVAVSAPVGAQAATVDCFHQSVKDPVACIADAIETKVPVPQGVVVFRDKDCNYLVVKPEGSNLYAFVHKLDGVRPKLGARLYGFFGFDSLFKEEGKARSMYLNEVGETLRLRNVKADLSATDAATLFAEKCTPEAE